MTVKSFSSPAGEIIIVAHKDSLVYCNWNTPACERKLKSVTHRYPEIPSPEEKEVLSKVISQLDEYFTGERTTFDLATVMKGSSFREKVWKAIEDVPFGNTVSYKALTEKIGLSRGYRAVAGACGDNPLAIIIPCHRIISSDGALGGYTGGIDKKVFLLRHERAVLSQKEG